MNDDVFSLDSLYEIMSELARSKKAIFQDWLSRQNNEIH